MSACALFPSLQYKQFPKSSPNPNECTHERNKSACTFIRYKGYRLIEVLKKKRTAYTTPQNSSNSFLAVMPAKTLQKSQIFRENIKFTKPDFFNKFPTQTLYRYLLFFGDHHFFNLSPRNTSKDLF